MATLTLTTAQKATILDQNSAQLTVGPDSASSDDNAVAYCENQDGFWFVVGQTVGTCTVTATRGGATDSELVEVVPVPFSIQFGTPEPK